MFCVYRRPCGAMQVYCPLRNSPTLLLLQVVGEWSHASAPFPQYCWLAANRLRGTTPSWALNAKQPADGLGNLTRHCNLSSANLPCSESPFTHCCVHTKHRSARSGRYLNTRETQDYLLVITGVVIDILKVRKATARLLVVDLNAARCPRNCGRHAEATSSSRCVAWRAGCAFQDGVDSALSSSTEDIVAAARRYLRRACGWHQQQAVVGIVRFRQTPSRLSAPQQVPTPQLSQVGRSAK